MSADTHASPIVFLSGEATAVRVESGDRRHFTIQLIPPIGQVWPGQGGVYAGLVRSRSKKLDHQRHLIVAEARPARALTWPDALAWASTIAADGHRDFVLPLRGEAAVVYGNLRELFQPVLHWTGVPRLPGNDAYVFVQDMDVGDQDYCAKHLQLSAFAVRTFPVDAAHRWPEAEPHRADEVAL